jgi:septum formation inhibitor-activating ATPase MinD
MEDFDDVIDGVGARLLAVIPHSPKLAYAANNTAPLPEDSLTPQIFDRLAQRLLGIHAPLLVH